ncbi:MAG TPA: BtrH N-terminal domain-containing protein [Solirubrobacterales bacterium]|nr:BtrH N-terminal domain-containing protein [Solirubrobacterales bacterium]
MPLVPNYTHLPGQHCGSTALRNLLAFHGVEMSEEMAFGLGAGACFYYVTIEGASPSRWFNGRAARLEENFDELTGGALTLRTFESADGEAWQAARAEVDSGNPVLLLTDLYHLDHYGNSAHFPGHAVVLAGYDDEVAYLSDTGFEELQTTRLENLDRARHGEHPAYPLAGHMFTAASGLSGERLREAAPAAIERAAREMLEPRFPGFSGIDAVRRLAAEVGSWPELAEDWRWCARFGYQVIERRGTGGGAFRLMYSRFLAEVGRPQADLAAEAAAEWTRLAETLRAASEADLPQAAGWRAADEAAHRVAVAEERLWSGLANSR